MSPCTTYEVEQRFYNLTEIFSCCIIRMELKGKVWLGVKFPQVIDQIPIIKQAIIFGNQSAPPVERLCHNSQKTSFRTSVARSGIQKYTTITKYSGSRLASRFAELGRDDELRHSLMRGEDPRSYRGRLNR